MAKLVGFQGKTFTFEDGNSVDGFYLFTEEKKDNVTGIATDRVFVSNKKLQGYVPVIGDEIIINYNRYGKPQSVLKA